MDIIDGEKVECSRCDEVTDLEEVNVLGKRHNRTYAKPICDDCLDGIGVPRGYELERDVSYLKQGSNETHS
ncbi:hypothetical protein HALLA_18130 [Halostagnicola larsenii XH-48]|uniref:Uncharacterized protein n=1 Tax=Halostagnicola larsenii XH-48 TaxID=797299 RepID=W0JT74_9EURY|nr:hypothetical protein [Halostagnicola larsenii]AHG00430.1 hypothetical protein HALLA_18130 [Halostagnicola larsenii XH-48]